MSLHFRVLLAAPRALELSSVGTTWIEKRPSPFATLPQVERVRKGTNSSKKVGGCVTHLPWAHSTSGSSRQTRNIGSNMSKLKAEVELHTGARDACDLRQGRFARQLAEPRSWCKSPRDSASVQDLCMQPNRLRGFVLRKCGPDGEDPSG